MGKNIFRILTPIKKTLNFVIFRKLGIQMGQILASFYGLTFLKVFKSDTLKIKTFIKQLPPKRNIFIVF